MLTAASFGVGELTAVIRSAEESFVKLELAEGFPTWEAMATSRHQRLLGELFESVRKPRDGDCGCFRYLDTYIQFPDGSFKRPDLAIYCERPPDSDGALTILPGAVFEIVSFGFEEKDRRGLEFYLRHGIADVVVYDPRTQEIIHATPTERRTLTAPVPIVLASGCEVVIPV